MSFPFSRLSASCRLRRLFCLLRLRLSTWDSSSESCTLGSGSGQPSSSLSAFLMASILPCTAFLREERCFLWCLVNLRNEGCAVKSLSMKSAAASRPMGMPPVVPRDASSFLASSDRSDLSMPSSSFMSPPDLASAVRTPVLGVDVRSSVAPPDCRITGPRFFSTSRACFFLTIFTSRSGRRPPKVGSNSLAASGRGLRRRFRYSKELILVSSLKVTVPRTGFGGRLLSWMSCTTSQLWSSSLCVVSFRGGVPKGSLLARLKLTCLLALSGSTDTVCLRCFLRPGLRFNARSFFLLVICLASSSLRFFFSSRASLPARMNAERNSVGSMAPFPSASK
mmetsp:Transcript_40256/g.125940  ORF Transcript_40256/g.125940 Transcript_40256/m.125940 type:complete len:337 (-) Transcript_40256:1116-2126(-)